MVTYNGCPVVLTVACRAQVGSSPAVQAHDFHDRLPAIQW